MNWLLVKVSLCQDNMQAVLLLLQENKESQVKKQ